MFKEGIDFDKKTIIIICVLLIAVAVAWDVFGSKLSNTGSGADTVRTNLSTVGQQQQTALDGIKRVETGLDDSAKQAGAISAGIGDTSKSITTVKDRIDTGEGQLKSSAGLIAEGESILKSVRERGQVGN